MYMVWVFLGVDISSLGVHTFITVCDSLKWSDSFLIPLSMEWRTTQDRRLQESDRSFGLVFVSYLSDKLRQESSTGRFHVLFILFPSKPHRIHLIDRVGWSSLIECPVSLPFTSSRNIHFEYPIQKLNVYRRVLF